MYIYLTQMQTGIIYASKYMKGVYSAQWSIADGMKVEYCARDKKTCRTRLSGLCLVDNSNEWPNTNKITFLLYRVEYSINKLIISMHGPRCIGNEIKYTMNSN